MKEPSSVSVLKTILQQVCRLCKNMMFARIGLSMKQWHLNLCFWSSQGNRSACELSFSPSRAAELAPVHMSGSQVWLCLLRRSLAHESPHTVEDKMNSKFIILVVLHHF
jgi:hypothetical protein